MPERNTRDLSYKNKEEERKARHRWYLAHREEHKVTARASHLRCTYNLTIEEYRAMLEGQNFRCAICHKSIGDGTAYIDHNHKTNKVRGILCMHCNAALGLLDESIECLERAVKYLEGDY